MKPGPFEYHAPQSLDDALALLEHHGIDAKVLAGGQSLVPLLNFRLARPDHLIDINGLAELGGIERRDGWLRVGALTRLSALERSPVVTRHWPMISEALEQVAHLQIRNRGTVGGSVAHADPSAELPAVLCALDASFVVRSLSNARVVSAAEFFLGPLVTALEAEELLVRIDVPPAPPPAGQAFLEHARRHGDFAVGGAAAMIELGSDRRCRSVAIAMLGAGATPIRARLAEERLLGRGVDEKTALSAAACATDEIEPTGDIHGSTSYRRQVVRTMTARAILAAAARAASEQDPS